MATVEGVLTNDEIVYVPRLMKFQMALSAYVFPIKKYTITLRNEQTN